MGRKALYPNAAERQRAYRARVAARNAERPDRISASKKRPLSRPAKLTAIITVATELMAEYQHWRDKLPDSLAETDQAESLEETIGLLEQAVDLLTQIQPPLGYGRVS